MYSFGELLQCIFIILSAVAGAIQNELVATQVGNILDGVVHLFLNRCYQCGALLEEFTLWSEVFLLQVSGFLLLGDDGILFGLLLLL